MVKLLLVFRSFALSSREYNAIIATGKRTNIHFGKGDVRRVVSNSNHGGNPNIIYI